MKSARSRRNELVGQARRGASGRRRSGHPLREHSERAIATGERQTYELAIELPGTAARRPAVDGRPAGRIATARCDQILAMSHDVTAQRRLVDELREADRRKSEFIAVLSHELRNPLAAIRTSLYVLEHGDAGQRAGGRRRGRSSTARSATWSAWSTISSTSRASPRTRSSCSGSALDLNELVRETIEDNRSHLERGGVRLEAQLAERAALRERRRRAHRAGGDEPALERGQVHARRGAAHRLGLGRPRPPARPSCRSPTPGRASTRLLLEQLFEPFMQGDRTLDRARRRPRARPGAGQGAGRAARRRGERAQRGARTRGAEFIVRLPLAGEAATGGRRRAAAETPAAARRRVLVDRGRPRRRRRAAGGARDRQPRGRGRAQRARRRSTAARTFRPDVVLCDIGLPGMNGYEVARAFRADEALRSTFLVALSGYAQAEDLAKARAAGFDQHLAKPANMEKRSGRSARPVRPDRTLDENPDGGRVEARRPQRARGRRISRPPAATCSVALHGAQVLSFAPRGERDWLWVSDEARWTEGTALRGGDPDLLPLVRPPPDRARLPGARLRAHPGSGGWRASTRFRGDAPRIAFELAADGATTPLYPHPFDRAPGP